MFPRRKLGGPSRLLCCRGVTAAQARSPIVPITGRGWLASLTLERIAEDTAIDSHP